MQFSGNACVYRARPSKVRRENNLRWKKKISLSQDITADRYQYRFRRIF